MHYIFLLALIFIPEIALSQPISQKQKNVFSSIQLTLQQPKILRAEFTQNRKLKALKAPLVSSGRMIYSPHKGIVWLIEKPHSIKFLIAPKGRIKNILAENSSAQLNPITQMISKILLATFSGDFSQLNKNFNVIKIKYQKGSAPSWSMHLQPKDKSVKKFILSLQLNGGAFISKIKLLEATGDSMSIRFHNLSPRPKALSKGERAYFSD